MYVFRKSTILSNADNLDLINEDLMNLLELLDGNEVEPINNEVGNCICRIQVPLGACEYVSEG